MKPFAALLLVVVAFQASSPSRADEKDGEKALVIGKVKAIDPAAGTISLEDRKKDGGEVIPGKTYKLALDAKVTNGEEAIKLGDIKAGAIVTVRLSDDQTVALKVAVNARKGKEEKRTRAQGGEVTKVDGKTFTLTRRGDGGERSDKFTLTDATKIVVETDENEQVTGEDGTVRNKPKQKAGTAADVKVGKHVNVQAGEDGKAIKVLVFRGKIKEGD